MSPLGRQRRLHGLTRTLYATAALAGTLSAIHAALLWYAGYATGELDISTAPLTPRIPRRQHGLGGSVYLLALTAPPNTDRDLVPRWAGHLIPAPAPRWAMTPNKRYLGSR